ncbi:hypothetical protein [Streptomyces sp. NPDC058371]|uniref:hypothetical protein n=1 Tax=Streptomyces sp. NPDC058371 TaxID=3346463 RepID=UPI0036677588
MAEWQWSDGRGGGGHMQAVVSSRYSRTQTAYRAYLDHSMLCDDCEYGEERCAVARELWLTYREARNE